MIGLRLRIAVVVAVSCAVVAVTVGAVGLRSTERRLVDEVDRSLDQVATLLVASGRAQGNVPTRVLGDVYSARRLSADGAILGSNFVVEIEVDEELVAELAGSPLAARHSSARAEDGSRFRVVSIGLDRGVVQIARPLEETDNVLDDLQRRTLLLVVLTAVTGAAIGWLVAGRIAAPLRRLAGAAETVEASGQLDVDLGPEGGRDEVGRLRRSFGSMLDALARSRADQQRLVQDAGHELRTPLTSLRTNLAVLRRHTDMPDEMRREVIGELESEVGELADLVDELVAAAHGEHADEPAVEIDVAELAVAVTERAERRRGRSITLDVGESARTVAGPLGLARAMSNVVDNACKFDTSAEPIVVSVRSRATPTGRVVEFRVVDQGPGVPDDEIDRIFDRFHRVESTRTMPGSGLGLAIVRDVVDRAGGSVVAANRPGGGAEIGFDLPSVT